MRRPGLIVLVAAGLVGCGGEAGDGGADPARALPAGSALYLELVVNPSEGVQRTKLEALAGRVLATGDPGAKIVALIERAAGEPGAYERDVKPWLGERAGVAISGFDAGEPQFVAAVAAKDTGAAAEAIERESAGEKARKGTYRDVDYFVGEDGDALGVVGDVVMIASSEAGLRRAVDAREGRTLAGDERFAQAVGRLPDDRVGTLFVDARTIVREAGAGDPAARAVLDSVLGSAPPVAVAALAEPDHLALESRSPRASGGVLGGLGSLGPTELLGELPHDAWGAVGVPALGATAREVMRLVAGPLGGAVLGGQFEQQLGISLERDVFSWLGDVALFARGDSLQALDGGLVIDVADQARARAAIPRLVGALQVQAGLTMRPVSLPGASLAFELQGGSSPQPVVVALAEGRAVIAFGRAAAADALRPGKGLRESDTWRRAGEVLDGLAPSLVLDVRRLVDLAAGSAAAEPGFAEARPYLERIDVIAAGGDGDGDELRGRLAVGVTGG